MGRLQKRVLRRTPAVRRSCGPPQNGHTKRRRGWRLAGSAPQTSGRLARPMSLASCAEVYSLHTGDEHMSYNSLKLFALPLLFIWALDSASASSPLQAPNGAAEVKTVAKIDPASQHKYDPDEVICKLTPVTGTRFPSRACLTRAQWDDLKTESRKSLEKAQQWGTKCEPTCK